MKPLSLFNRARTLAHLGVGALLLVGATATGRAEPPSDIQLPAAAKGAAAIGALREHLPQVAKAYGLEPQELATLFQLQPSLGVDISGALVFACAGAPVEAPKDLGLEPSGAMAATSSLTQLSSGSAVDAFQLHSLPGASRVIYLDFNGHTTSGTIWNSSWTGGATIVSQPFDQDGDPSTFSESERAAIQGIWKRVAEDYAPFAIDVTTQDPGVDALRRTTSSDTSYGIRAIISPTSFMGGWGGYAYIGSFNWSTDSGCFIFTQNLANAEKYIAEAVSHEVGHTLGLNHDGASGSSPTEYYYGQGNWAPIMGIGYYASVTQFSKGEYANATNLQDDLAVIATYAPLVSDDHGNTTATATVLTGPTVANGGTIETRTDVDLFRFDSGEGVIALNIVSPAGEPDLHLKAELLNSSNQVLSVADAVTGNIAFNLALSAGTYYLRLTGIGFGDAKTTGYTSYGSLGNYVITGTLVAISGKQAPTARASASTTSGTAALAVNFTGQNSSDPDGAIVSYSWNFGNGTTSAAMNPSCTYTAAGTYIALLTVVDNDGLASSASVAITVTATVASNLPPIAKASANVTSGTAPLAINFSSTGSSDPDGSIASYKWNFGDGSSSTAASPSKTYSTAGNYNVVLTVTDSSGATASASISISITAGTGAAADVRSYSLSNSAANSGASAIGLVQVRDAQDQPVVGATVTIQWSGLVSNKTTGKTDANGQVLMTSGRTKKQGTITGTITAVLPPSGLVYDGTLYSAPTVASTSVN
jgi:PKD repeat protein